MSDQEAWIQASLETLEELENERKRLERRLESENQPAAIRKTSVRLEQLDLEIESLYSTLEAAAEQMEEEGKAKSPSSDRPISKPIATLPSPANAKSVPSKPAYAPKLTPRSEPILTNGRDHQSSAKPRFKPSIHEMDTKPTPTQFYNRSSASPTTATTQSQSRDDVRSQKSATETYGSNHQMWTQSGVDAAARQALMSKWRAAKQNALESRGETQAPTNQSELSSLGQSALERNRRQTNAPRAQMSSRSTPTIGPPSSTRCPPPLPQYLLSEVPSSPPPLSAVPKSLGNSKHDLGSVMREVMDDDSGPTLVTTTPKRESSKPLQSPREHNAALNSKISAASQSHRQKIAPQNADPSATPAVVTLQPEEAIAHAESIEAEIEVAMSLVETTKKDEQRWSDEMRRAREATSAAEKMIADAREAQLRAERLVSEARARRTSAIETARAKQAEAQAARAHVEQTKLIKRMTDELESEVWVAEAHLGKLQEQNSGHAKIYSGKSKVAMDTATEAEKIAEVKKAEAEQAMDIAERAREEAEKARQTERNAARQRATVIRTAQEAVSQAKAKLKAARQDPLEALRQRTANTKTIPAASGVQQNSRPGPRTKSQNHNGDVPVKRMPETTLN